MNRWKIALAPVVPICLAMILIMGTGRVFAQGAASPGSASAPTSAGEYVGTEKCATCHKALYEEWLLTPHRRTLAQGREPSLSGCEGCHGPGGQHVTASGDIAKITKLRELDPQKMADVCLKCHRQGDVMLFRTSPHAMAKVKCISCHAVHQPGRATMLQQIESQQYSIRGLATQIQEAKQKASISSNSDDRNEALAEALRLETTKAELQKSLAVIESRSRRASEPELCFTCHKEQQAQFRLPAHHPVPEGKMQCTSCHNVHGGPAGNLREENVNQTCSRCHPEFEGPYLFEHPPVEEDCTICHRPHGSPQNYLLKQSEPFLCLKCHPGPHSRGGTLRNGSTATSTSRIPYYYWQCTSCHARPHGSDRHAAFHY